MPITDQSPSGSILAVNNSIKAVLLPANSRTPTTYVLTLGTAPTANDTEITVATIVPAPSAQAPLLLEDGAQLSFGGKVVTVQNDVPGDTVQTITTGSSVTIKTKPILAADLPTTGSTATSKNLLELLGVQNMDYNRSSNLISIRSQKSGLGNEQRTTMINYAFSVSGWIHQKDQCFSKVIEPAFSQSREVYAEVSLANGLTVSGVFGVSNLNIPIQLDQVLQMSFELYAQGVPSEVYS